MIMVEDKFMLIHRIKTANCFTGVEKQCLIDLVDNDRSNAWEVTQYGMIPIKGRYENVPQGEKLLFYDEKTDDFFVGEVNDTTLRFPPDMIANGYHGFPEASWWKGERFDPQSGKTLEYYYGEPTHFAYLNNRPKKYICENCGHAVSVLQRYCDRCGIEFKTEEGKNNATITD